MSISRTKVHFLRPGLYGLFENFMTFCDRPVRYVRDCYTRGVRDGARFDYTNKPHRVTCLTCQRNMKGEMFVCETTLRCWRKQDDDYT